MPGFYFRGKHSSEFGLFVKTMNNPLLPSRNETRVTIPGRAGNLVFDGEPNNKTLSFSLTLIDQLNYRRAEARNIAAWLSGTGSLIMDYEPDKRYEVINVVNNVPTMLNASNDIFSVDFECEPYQYGNKRGYSGAHIIAENIGTAPADTIITITGRGTISVVSDNQLFSVTNISDTVVVDSKRMTIRDLYGQNLTHIHSGGFINVPPGGAQIRFTGDIAYVSLEYWEMWL